MTASTCTETFLFKIHNVNSDLNFTYSNVLHTWSPERFYKIIWTKNLFKEFNDPFWQMFYPQNWIERNHRTDSQQSLQQYHKKDSCSIPTEWMWESVDSVQMPSTHHRMPLLIVMRNQNIWRFKYKYHLVISLLIEMVKVCKLWIIFSNQSCPSLIIFTKQPCPVNDYILTQGWQFIIIMLDNSYTPYCMDNMGSNIVSLL